VNETAITMSIPTAGAKYFGLGRGASYTAADRGDLPTIRVGRSRRVIVAALEKRIADAASQQS